MSDTEEPSGSGGGGGSGWMEPPWTGFIESTGDALLILEAARQGIIPRVTRRLVEAERKMIGSGAVFVFDEEESGIKRWTDGFFWSPSRILGNFLLYRETEKKPTNRGRAKRPEPAEQAQPPMSAAPIEHNGEARHTRALVGSLTDTQKFKSEGLMKKTFSLSIGGVAQHLISYYRPSDVESGRLKTPSAHDELSKLQISPEYLDKTHFRLPPRTEVGPDGIPRYVGEAEELDLTKPAPPPRATAAKRHNPMDQSKRPRRGAKKEEQTEPYPAPFFMPPPYQSYQPYFVGAAGAGAAPGAGAYYAPYQVAPYGTGYAVQPPPDEDEDEDADVDGDGGDEEGDGDGDEEKEKDVDADAEGEEDA